MMGSVDYNLLPECISLQSLICNADLCHTQTSQKKKDTEYNNLPQSILVASCRCHQ